MSVLRILYTQSKRRLSRVWKLWWQMAAAETKRRTWVLTLLFHHFLKRQMRESWVLWAALVAWKRTAQQSIRVIVRICTSWHLRTRSHSQWRAFRLWQRATENHLRQQQRHQLHREEEDRVVQHCLRTRINQWKGHYTARISALRKLRAAMMHGMRAMEKQVLLIAWVRWKRWLHGSNLRVRSRTAAASRMLQLLKQQPSRLLSHVRICE